MSGLTGAVIVAAVVALTTLVLPGQLRRARAEESTKDRIIRESLTPAPREPDWVYTGPDALKLLVDLDAHLDAYFAPMAHLFEPPDADAELVAGCDRLRDAINEHRKEQP